MIPVRLEIEGLYSYREKQTIEFDKLTAAGLFGIFGAVGSGKSSILEAILLALYGSTERLSDRGERASMLNLQSDQVLILFTFQAGKNNSNLYLARYFAKRNKKDREKIELGEHVFYRKKGTDWEAIEESASDILGMSKEHFKQTVIIPQGKFREFIDQKPSDRAEMMMLLFGLDRFDLSQKTGSLLKATREEKIRLETQLKGLEEISLELLTQKQEAEKALKTQVSEAKAKLEKSEASFKVLEQIKNSFLQLQEHKSTLRDLESRKPEIEQKRKDLKEFLTAKTHLKPVWDRLQDAQKDLEKYLVCKVDCERFKEVYAKEVSELEEEERKLQAKNEERPIREARIRDLQKVMEIQELEGKLNSANQNLEALKPELEKKKSALKAQEQDLEQLEIQLEKLPIPNTEQLASFQTMRENWKNSSSRKKELEQIHQTFIREEKVVSETIANTLARIPAPFTDLESWAKDQKSKIQNLDQERENLLRKQGLGTHVHLLVNGEPCPLCGSKDHPSPLQKEEDEKEIRKKELLIQQEKDELERILAHISNLKVEEANLENHRRNIREKAKEIGELEKQLQEIQSKWKELGITDLDQLEIKIQELGRAGNQREELSQSIQAKRKNWNNLRLEVEDATKGLQKWENSISSFKALIQSKREEIKDPTFCKPYFSKSTEDINSTIAKVTQDIKDAVALLSGKQKHLLDKRTAQTKNLADLENYSNLVLANQKKVQENSDQLEVLKTQFGFKDNETLQHLFHHSLEEDKVEAELRTFDQKYHLTKSRIEELSKDEKVLSYSEEAFQVVQAELEQAKSLAIDLQNQFVLLQDHLNQIAQQLEQKLEISKLFDLVENRENGLKELERLFQGKGFVKYVSSIYLRELCNTANIRFMKLTKNSLSLEIDGENTFWVVDYLNGGRRRLLKTLSGGQTFQASLCLALALAEKVKALNQADQSFFFLDEGFGALDRNALRVVFETLKSLRHENRVVGIISHVEELQQEIGVFAQIELDPEKGSTISYSY
ncbi:exonuclease SbcC [Algoriphagus boseongensis]|uniref:Exonuclease SbcC n=1 Tax=Algoriphagus boseongensis TaxID=1442587 RepID=A0A4R6T2Z0_9BACT|nr:SMC family ATPase [Algoriphagus boseongensis]TDQ14784.1 exonuclease SbcC [Algoriphagus boseongensis]